MPITGYFNMSRNTVTNDVAGLSQIGYIALLPWFDDLQDPGADKVTISTDHTFLTSPTGAGFIKLYSLPKDVEANGETNGDAGALNLNWKYTMFLPGDDAATQAMAENLKNQDVIFAYEDAKCPNGARYQFGNLRCPANITSVKPVSGKRGEGKKGWEIVIEAQNRYFYSGVLTLMA